MKEEFQGIDKTRKQQIINLRSDFENLKMNESKLIMVVVNNIRLLGDHFLDYKVIKKVITTLIERYK
ncbi:pleiotropic drug resistance protein 3-like [Gossypium australe]|uniref:Pleiotropic drug resistance protein 3-like n=1 Tax=Gossypium australe TaxID=47621 RepID=A0A5B6WYE7_9ROSI|nr:pleiotropic drug resistance protein 3-like [Gossypium australe]